MIYGSVCSGIEAATQAWHPLGWRASFFSEIEAFPRAVLKHRNPEVPLHGDFTTIECGEYRPIDLLVGGTPCQSFSVAGLRGGLGDERGNLALEFLRLADRLGPRWVVWENVPGVLSSNEGREFGAILGGLVELGYGFVYRVLDAQYVRTRGHPWAVPQRRRRVFVVGYLGDWRRAAAVLFDRESLQGHPPPRRKAGQISAPTLSARTKGGGGLGTDFDLDGGLVVSDVAPTVRAGGNTTGGDRPYGTDVDTSDSLIAHAIAIQERAVSENPDAGPDGAGVRSDGAAFTLESRSHSQAVAFAENSRAELRLCGGDGQVCSQLTTGGGKPGQGLPAVAFDMRGREGGAMLEGPHETANLRAASGGSSRSYVAEAWAVRRLTPLECERLQGFPDGFTAIPMEKRNRLAEADEMLEYYRRTGQDEAIRRGLHMAPDGPRYKALGNSMAVNVMRWIGDRIELVEKVAGENAA